MQATERGSSEGPVQETAVMLEQQQLATDTYSMRIYCPEVASRIVPGQFFMIRRPDTKDPLLGRPFALFDVFEQDGAPVGIEFAYLVVGKLTRQMPHWRPEDRVEIWGPLGNGFPQPEGGHLLCVAGGIGQTPFLAVAREALGLHSYGKPPRTIGKACEGVTLCYGVRSAERLAAVKRFEQIGVDVRVATEDGSAGHKGLVDSLVKNVLEQGLRPERIYCCGPEPMLAAVVQIAGEFNIPCWVSLETPMACGIGACFSCVTKIRTGRDQWDYKRVCLEGPVFPADKVVF